MSGTPTYLRGSAGLDVDPGRVIRVVVALGVLMLLAVMVATTIGATEQNSAQTRLQHDGVPVEVTVTGCVGVSSGICQALIYDTCRGTYTFDGHRYNEVIGGNRSARPADQTLRAVTVPGHPALLSTSTAVAKSFSPWTPYITPIVVAAVTVAVALVVVLRSNRRKRSRSRPTIPSDH